METLEYLSYYYLSVLEYWMNKWMNQHVYVCMCLICIYDYYIYLCLLPYIYWGLYIAIYVAVARKTLTKGLKRSTVETKVHASEDI